MSKEMRKYIDTFKERLTESENLDISDVRSSKLNNGRFFLIQEDGGDQLHFTGIYDNLESFTNDIKDKISQKENIDISEIKIEFEGIESSARLVTTANAKNLSQRIEQMEAALDVYDNEILSLSNEA